MARKKNERAYTKEEEEIRANIHRLNERMRYTHKKYGANSQAYKLMIEEAKKLVVGIGGKGYNMALEKRKNGLFTIPETFGTVTRMATAMKRRKNYASTWNEVYKNFNPQSLLMKEIKRSGYYTFGKIFKKTEELEKFVKENVTKYKFMSDTVEECFKRGILNSDEVNRFHHYRGNFKMFMFFLNNHPNFDGQNWDDLEEFGDFVRTVINDKFGINDERKEDRDTYRKGFEPHLDGYYGMGDYFGFGNKNAIERSGKLTLAQYTDKANSTSMGIKGKKALQHDKSVDEYLKLAGFINKNK